MLIKHAIIKDFFTIKTALTIPMKAVEKTNYLMKKINTTFCLCDKHPAKLAPQAKDHRCP